MASSVAKTAVNLLHHYEGALVGALVGDCLGAPFEFKFSHEDDYDKTIGQILKFFRSVDKGKKRGKCDYTDDTAMLRCVSKSLVEQKKFDARNLSKRFTDEFVSEPNRGYGGSIHTVFQQLSESDFADPFGPASRQFGGAGSYGNGGAMRIAPAALFGLHLNENDLNDLVINITKITHSNKAAIDGAILECSAVWIALRAKLSEKPLNTDEMVTELLSKMQRLEDNEEKPYASKLMKIQELLQEPSPSDVEVIVKELGNDVSAIDSVPSAIFAFLRSMHQSPEEWEAEFDPFERTIIYAISLGGDTDTIASMAGAIAGSYYGIDAIPDEWQEACEKLDEAKEQARQLYELAEENRKAAAAANSIIS